VTRSDRDLKMSMLISRIRRFHDSDDGPTAVEYAMIVGFVVIAIFAIVSKIASEISGTFSSVSSTLGS
jgi:pilus assembly protein Flp/PilA